MFNEGKSEVAMDLGLEAIRALKARGAVWDCDIELVRRGVLAGRPVTREEADALFEVERANIEKCQAWTCFLVEAITLCLMGCAIGLLIGFSIVLAMKSFGGDTSPVAKAEAPLWSIILSVAFSASTGVIFGMFPAIKASRLDPIVALRHE